MGACCSNSKAAEPVKRNEMVKAEKAVETPTVEPNSVTHNVLVVNEKTSVVVAEVSTKANEDTVKASEDQPTPKSSSGLPPLGPNKARSNHSISTEATEQSESSPTASSRTSDSFPLSRTSSSRPRVLSSDISSRSSFTSTKKEHREFRFFLPVIDEADESWIDPDLIAAYKTALEVLQSAFRDGEDGATAASEDWKDDTYIVGRSYFSLRYLEDKKLEMRVKTENTPIWMEKWSKVRFGKKAIGHYRADIISYLHDVGHKDPLIDKIIDEPQLLTIQRREINTLPEFGVELSAIRVPEQKEQQQVVRQRQWLTFCMAADSTKIQEFIFNHNINNSSSSPTTTTTALWSVVQLGSDIFDSNNEAAMNQSFLPVMSSYALWVRLVVNKYGTIEAWKDELLPALDSFLLFLKGDAQ